MVSEDSVRLAHHNDWGELEFPVLSEEELACLCKLCDICMNNSARSETELPPCFGAAFILGFEFENGKYRIGRRDKEGFFILGGVDKFTITTSLGFNFEQAQCIRRKKVPKPYIPGKD